MDYCKLYAEAGAHWQERGVSDALRNMSTFSDHMKRFGYKHMPKLLLIEDVDRETVRVHFKKGFLSSRPALPAMNVSKNYAGGRIELLRDIYPAMRR
ncbi:hypothetical protein ACFFUB_09250 [Algimonas porphyrae]|uniref:Uncharacterized protein n=1 Tax=Algimonas porphyrae TaxID=1128113 RepID=A0ABQ5V404_9PROT|nr:hypothetical protein [Algimonas porphyrae]GLQ21699.1 hypothetical protein GCM10007854_26540 [Algimonas porphyrae]